MLRSIAYSMSLVNCTSRRRNSFYFITTLSIVIKHFQIDLEFAARNCNNIISSATFVLPISTACGKCFMISFAKHSRLLTVYVNIASCHKFLVQILAVFTILSLKLTKSPSHESQMCRTFPQAPLLLVSHLLFEHLYRMVWMMPITYDRKSIVP